MMLLRFSQARYAIARLMLRHAYFRLRRRRRCHDIFLHSFRFSMPAEASLADCRR